MAAKEDDLARVRQLIEQGRPTRAFDLARAALVARPGDPDFTYLLALALRRGGNVAASEEYLEPLLDDRRVRGTLRVDARALRGALDKLRMEREPAGSPRRAELARESAKHYALASRVAQSGAWTLANAATMNFVAGDARAASSWAERAETLAREELTRDGSSAHYWTLATLGEACAVQAACGAKGKLADAVASYRDALAQARGARAWGDVASMRQNLLLLRQRADLDDELLRMFVVGSVLAFSGHLLDRPGAAGPLRFPDDGRLVEAVRKEIRARLDAHEAVVGVTSLGCGSDLLFAEEMLARCERRYGELHVVLPFARQDFYETSVDYREEGPAWRAWRERFDAVLLSPHVKLHYATEDGYLGDDVLFEFCTELTQGLALLRAEQRGIEPRALSVFDPSSALRPGGTADFVERWRELGKPGETIDLARQREALGMPPPPVTIDRKSPQPKPPQDRMSREIKAMLFADVKGFSALTDAQLPQFLRRFLDRIANVLKEMRPGPAYKNTWGDGLYLVFDEVEAAAEAALRMLELFEGEAEQGVRLRVGAHVGPVFRGYDGVQEREGFFGGQVTRAARIEPVTMPGCLYVSEPFAAMLALRAGSKYASHYLGEEELAKGYGRCALYRVGRRPEG